MSAEVCNIKKVEALKLEEFEKLEVVSSALANKARLAILSTLLKYEEVCACELQPALNLSQPTLTVHLHVLYNAGILKKREVWKYTYFSIKEEYYPFVKIILNLKN